MEGIDREVVVVVDIEEIEILAEEVGVEDIGLVIVIIFIKMMQMLSY